MSPGTATRATVHYLVPPGTVAETPGSSAAFELGPLGGKPLLIVLRLTEIVEQESLHVSLWGSRDGNDWGTQALFWFPQKFYRGATPAALDLRQHPEIKFLQARWEVNRWGRCDPRPFFKFSVEVEELPAG